MATEKEIFFLCKVERYPYDKKKSIINRNLHLNISFYKVVRVDISYISMFYYYENV